MYKRKQTDVIWQSLAISIFSTCVITACSSDSDDTPPIPLSPPDLSFTSVSDAPLASNNQISPSRYVKNGLYLTQVHASELVSSPTSDNNAPPEGRFSTTNTQIEGVDEADRIEYNGTHMIVADLPIWVQNNQPESKVRFLERQADFSLNEVASVSMNPDFNIAGMYLNESTLGIVSQAFQFYPMNDAITLDSPLRLEDNDVEIDVYDVSNPASPQISADITIDGGLINSRRIDDNLYLAMQYVPTKDDLTLTDNTDDGKIAFYQALLNVDNSDLVPQITINGVSADLYQLDDCLLPENVTSQHGHTQMVSVVRINMNNPNNVDAVCMLTQAHGLFMSQSNVYLYSALGEGVVFHKVSLGSTMQYEASGSTEGTFGWRSTPQFRMAERQNKLLTLTTSQADTIDPIHSLHVLEQQGNSLVEVATLPNENQPAPIGKPGEDVYAVRYFEDKAYVVTFEQIDPLYVIDITDPTSPTIEGELEIPGFSSYLHPMDNGLLLGIGQQVNAFAIPLPGADVITDFVEEGMKITLFDVQDPANPIALNEFVWPNTYTPVAYDHRALSVIKTDTGYRFALPSESLVETNNTLSWNNALQLLEVNETQRSLSLIDGIVTTDPKDFYYGSYEDRSVIHNDHVYYLRGNHVYHSLWQVHSPLDGPY